MTKRSGAWLVRYALERLPVSHTFGIPGVHNTEIYDELAQSEKIRPVLVTHEGGGAFAADAMSRTSTPERATPARSGGPGTGGGRIGCLLIVPAAGLTQAMSGIAEAYLAGVPMLVITGGIRLHEQFGFQIHNVDQQRLAESVVKRSWKITSHGQIVPAIFEAYRTAIERVPGPVLVEIPADVQMARGEVGELPSSSIPVILSEAKDLCISGEKQGSFAALRMTGSGLPFRPDEALDRAARLLLEARSPGIFVGWGAVDAGEHVARIAELLGAPVATTLQGLSAFPGNHPLHAGMGFSAAAVPAAENAFRDCDCLLAIGTRFAEIPTGSFSCRVPEDLIHIDLDPEVIGRNFPAKVGIVGDAREIVPALAGRLRGVGEDLHSSPNQAGVGRPQDLHAERRERLAARIAADKQAYRDEWRAHRAERVNPALFFEELRRQLPDDAILTVDDGNHTFLAAELFEVRRPRTFLSPVDFNCMGYAVPAAIGARLANPGRQVVGVVGDGAFLMTGMEVATAGALRLPIVYFVFRDGELSQISQGQQLMYSRKTCTQLGEVRLEPIAEGLGARYVAMENNTGIEAAIRDALAFDSGPVVVDVRVDYSKRTRFTQGVARAVMNRMELGQKARFVGRAVWRKLTE
jgi:acetolactate synthase-1/2/3 large subunit